MPDTKVEGVELKKLIKKGKRRPMSFAFCPGPKGDHILLIDRRKKPDVLSRIARRDGPGNRVACGTFVVKAKTLELTCVQEIPNMAMSLKKYLKSNRVFLNILITNLQGDVLERDDEELPDDPDWDSDDADDAEEDAEEDADDVAEDDAGVDADDDGGGAQETDPVEAAGNTPDPASVKAALAGRIKAVQPALSAVSGDAGEVLRKAFAKTVAQIRSGDLNAAGHTIAMLETAVAKLTAAASGGQTPLAAAKTPVGAAPEIGILAARANGLKQRIGEISGPAAEQLNKALQGAVKQIRAGKLVDADALLTKIEGAAGRVAKQDAPAPDINGPYAGPRQAWAQARREMRRELEGLKSAIDQATAGIDGLQEVPARSGVLLDYLDGIDSSLEDTLALLGEAPDDTRHEDLKSAARKIIAQYHSVLDGEFFLAVDSSGFVKSSIRADALKSLQQVSAALET